MTTLLVSLGSNLGNRRGHLAEAARRIASWGEVRNVRVSRLWTTEAWGGPGGQQDFLNAALRAEVEGLDVLDVLDRLLALERAAGRVRTVRNGPRTLDLDILLFGAAIVEEPGLVVPHRRMHERSFVLGPAAEVAGELTHPVLGTTLADLALLVGRQGVVAVGEESHWYHAVGHSQSL